MDTTSKNPPRSPGYRQQLGAWGERVAENHLTARGFRLVERNVRTPYGELDLVMRLGTMLVFVEVKARSGQAYGFPEASVTLRKQAHILDAIQAFLQAHPELDCDWRVDVVAIQGTLDAPNPVITHFENALA